MYRIRNNLQYLTRCVLLHDAYIRQWIQSSLTSNIMASGMLADIGLGNALMPVRRQAISWIITSWLFVKHAGANVREIGIKA